MCTMAFSIRNTFSFRMFKCLNRFTFFYSVSSKPIVKQGKVFVEHENLFARSVFLRLPQYQNSIVPPNLKDINYSITDKKNQINWDLLPLDELCTQFEKVGNEAKVNSLSLEDKSFTSMCNSIAKRCPELSDEHIVKLLNSLSFWPYSKSPKEKNFYILWKALDEACLNKWKSWDVNKILFYTDLWFNIHLTRQSDFVFKSIGKVASRPSRLSPHQLVQLLFFFNTIRTLSKGIEMFNIEHRLESIINELSIEEIGIAAMGFFKTKTIFHSEKLINCIIDRVMDEINTIPEISLASILKALRYSLTIPLWDRMPEFLDALETQLDRLTLQCSIHINLLAAKSLILHEGTLTKITKKMCNEIKGARLKDMEKLLYPLTMLNYNPATTPCIFETIMNEIADPVRAEEIDKYAKSLIALLYYLTLRNYFAEDAVAKVLDINFIRRTYGKHNYMIGREILGIDTYIEVMKPSYSGPRLPFPLMSYMSKRYSAFNPDPSRKLTNFAQFRLDVFQTCQKLFGDDCAIFKYTIPHHSRADIILQFDKNNKPRPISEEYRKILDFTGPVKAPNNGTWVALILASRNMYMHNVPIVIGETSSKLQMLEKLGYKPIMVSYLDWPNDEDEKMKLEFLKKIIYA